MWRWDTWRTQYCWCVMTWRRRESGKDGCTYEMFSTTLIHTHHHITTRSGESPTSDQHTCWQLIDVLCTSCVCYLCAEGSVHRLPSAAWG